MSLFTETTLFYYEVNRCWDWWLVIGLSCLISAFSPAAMGFPSDLRIHEDPVGPCDDKDALFGFAMTNMDASQSGDT